jgi:retron-type reverse transcriptase
MRRVGNLWPQLTSFGNLALAAHDAAAGKRRRPDVAAFFLDLEWHLLELRKELLEGRYSPGPYRTFQLLDPKPRLISAAPFRDRVVHHALTQVLEPVFEPRFSPCSFACRVGMGTHKALERAQAGVRRFSYVLKCDVRKYFASIDHEILKTRLARAVKCGPTLDLASRIVAGWNSPEKIVRYYPGDDLFTPFERKRGLPLGNQTSQFFANVYLNEVDHRIAHEIGSGLYARYVDDLVLFGDSRQRLEELKEILHAALDELRLEVHSGKSRIYRCSEGVTFLGWRLFPDRAGQGCYARLVRGNVVRFGRRMKRLTEDFHEGRLKWPRVEESVRAWIAHAAFGKTWILRERLLARFAFRLGAGRVRARGRFQ